jgi:protein-S-isoprenylcysteine O-methyltransferase
MAPLFASLLEEIVFWGLFATYFATVVIWATRHMVRMARDERRRGKRRADPFPLIMLAMLIAVAIGYARLGPLPHWLFYPGVILFVAGGLFTLWSYAALGRYLSPQPQVLPGHEVIEAGPYRYVRHPGYLGQMVAFIGLGLAMQSWVALLGLVIIAVGLLALRIRREEELLVAELGERYLDYAARTKRFIPRIW